MAIEDWPQAEVPEAIERQIVAITEREWPSDGAPRHPRHDVLLDPVTVVNLVDGAVVAALSILSSTITHGGITYWASGLSAVVTDSAKRGHGYGLQLAAAARELIRSWKVDLSVFTCDPRLVPFYEKAGWTATEESYLVGGTLELPLLSSGFGKVLMLDLISAQAIEQAHDFHQARIELYPGNIDKLW